MQKTLANSGNAINAYLLGLSDTPLHRLPREAGGGLPSPKGDHRRLPAFSFTALGNNRFLALVDVCDLGNMDMCKGG